MAIPSNNLCRRIASGLGLTLSRIMDCDDVLKDDKSIKEALKSYEREDLVDLINAAGLSDSEVFDLIKPHLAGMIERETGAKKVTITW